MSLKRYGRTPVLKAGKQYGTSDVIFLIRKAVEDGRIALQEIRQIREGERLDTIAGKAYNGQSELYWIIAAASGIGWSLQVPPGIEIKIPRLEDVQRILG